MLQASGFDGVAFDAFSFQQDGLTPREVNDRLSGRASIASSDETYHQPTDERYPDE
jgi:hypothetical protein